jgi:hypothetical protein
MNRKMLRCYAVKRYTPAEKLQQIDRVEQLKTEKIKRAYLIDVAVSADRNVQKEEEKKLKYRRLSTEIQRTWNMKCKNIPVITGATGMVTKILRKNLETTAGKHSVHSLQETTKLGPHIKRKVLQWETGNLSSGDRRWFERRNARVKSSATRHNNKNNNNNNTIMIIIITFSRRS